MIHINIDGEKHQVPAGWSVATAVSHVKGIENYRLTEQNHRRAPMCHMGVCYECSLHVSGQGNVRGCMVQATEGMEIRTLHAEALDWKESEREILSENDHIYDVAIIGAGPAGMGAADELAKSEKDVLLIDEQLRAGGQIYKQPFAGRQPPHQLILTVDQLVTIDRLFGHAVWSIQSYTASDQITADPKSRAFFRVFLENHSPIRAKKILLATGAYDRIHPVRGWTLPGVMSAGGIQVQLKTQNYAAGQSVVLTGSHPFILIVGKLLCESGVEVKGIAIAQSLKTLLKMSKHAGTMRHHRAKLNELKNAIQILRKNQVPIWFNAMPTEIAGEEKVRAVTIKQSKAAVPLIRTIPCEVVGMCYGFTPVLDLAKQAGCHIERTAHGTRKVVINEQNETSIQGIFAAGELIRVGGAERSEAEGRLVGRNLGGTDQGIEKQSLKKAMEKWNRFAEVLAEVELEAWRLTDFQTFEENLVLCKCENVTVQDIHNTLMQPSPPTDLNSIKLQTRCGMGLCQGKYCEESLYRVACGTLSEPPLTDTFNGQSPAKAIAIRNL
ncbi:FAD-dependent oxidoreductase [Metaplanococcus flavidus]|uniref:FAD-dependent oxidoreductase n=1 Tax=Metaplanococcus flavidus TaxID=569883 RepID=A0ABW3LAV6_9BACL